MEVRVKVLLLRRRGLGWACEVLDVELSISISQNACGLACLVRVKNAWLIFWAGTIGEEFVMGFDWV